VEDLERLLEVAKKNYTQLGGTLPEERRRLQTIRDKDKYVHSSLLHLCKYVQLAKLFFR